MFYVKLSWVQHHLTNFLHFLLRKTSNDEFWRILIIFECIGKNANIFLKLWIALIWHFLERMTVTNRKAKVAKKIRTKEANFWQVMLKTQNGNIIWRKCWIGFQNVQKIFFEKMHIKVMYLRKVLKVLLELSE